MICQHITLPAFVKSTRKYGHWIQAGYILHIMMWDHSHIIWTPEYRPEKPEHSWPLMKPEQMTSLHQISMTKQQVIRAVHGKLDKPDEVSRLEYYAVSLSVVPNILNDLCAFTFLNLLTLMMKGTTYFQNVSDFSSNDMASHSKRLRSSWFDTHCTNTRM